MTLKEKSILLKKKIKLIKKIIFLLREKKLDKDLLSI